MRRRPALLILTGVLLLLGVAVFLWKTGPSSIQHRESRAGNPASSIQYPASGISQPASQRSTLNAQRSTGPSTAERMLAEREKRTPKFKNRLTNTQSTVGELMRKDHAILLANALLDTEQPITLNIPEHLRSEGDPGTYIAQSKEVIDQSFREALKQAGATIVSYVPNNAYLVRASKEVAQQLVALPQMQTVLPYEPYYKLQAGLLEEAVNQRTLPEGSILNVLLFADAKETAIDQLKKLGAEVVAEERSYFGHVVKVVASEKWLQLPRLPGVQMIEVSRSRVQANDLSRVRIGVATDTTTDNNYLGLTGSPGTELEFAL